MRELAEGQVSPAYSGEYEFYRGRGQKQFPKAMEPSRPCFVRGGACSPNGVDLSQIQNVIRSIGALLIGAYRPVDITP
jgi:hypothetical protein